MKLQNNRKNFTLLELMVAMGVLAVFMVAMMEFFSASQTLLSLSSARASTYERARVAMDLLANDFQGAFYLESMHYPAMAVEQGTDAAGDPMTEQLFLVTTRKEKLENCKTGVTCVLYEFDEANRKLSLREIGDGKEDNSTYAAWNELLNSSDPCASASWNNVDGATLLNGVLSFYARPMYAVKNGSDWDYQDTIPTDGSGARIVAYPAYVQLKIELVDDRTEALLADSRTPNAVKQQRKASNRRVFTREIKIAPTAF